MYCLVGSVVAFSFSFYFVWLFVSCVGYASPTLFSWILLSSLPLSRSFCYVEEAQSGLLCQCTPPLFVLIASTSCQGETFCKFKFYLDHEMTETGRVAGTVNPSYAYEKQYSFTPVTKQVSDNVITDQFEGKPSCLLRRIIWGCMY